MRRVDKTNLYDMDNENRRRLIASKDNRRKIIEAYYDTPFGGRQGIDRTIDVIKERYCWKNMSRDREQYVQTCKKCNKRKTFESTLTDSDN